MIGKQINADTIRWDETFASHLWYIRASQRESLGAALSVPSAYPMRIAANPNATFLHSCEACLPSR